MASSGFTTLPSRPWHQAGRALLYRLGHIQGVYEQGFGRPVFLFYLGTYQHIAVLVQAEEVDSSPTVSCSGLEFVEYVPQVLDIAAVSSVGPRRSPIISMILETLAFCPAWFMAIRSSYRRGRSVFRLGWNATKTRATCLQYYRLDTATRL
jgi:hypothetical protein